MKKIRNYLITLLMGLAGVACIISAKDIFQQTEPVVIYHILSDAFCVVGTVLFCAGLLVFSSNEGTFDMLIYGVSSFVDMFRVKSKKKYDTFYDYRVSRADKRVRFGFLLICGLLFLAVALVMYYLYRQCS